MFADDPPEVDALAREDQRRNHPDALAAVLRGIGTGEMTPLWDRLRELEMPTTVIVGDRDAKFQALGRRMVDLMPHAVMRTIRAVHRLPAGESSRDRSVLEHLRDDGGTSLLP